MSIGFVGLGKMGQNMVIHLVEQGVDVVGFNRTEIVTKSFTQEISQFHASGKFSAVYDIASLVETLSPSRIIWLMVDAGLAVDGVTRELLEAGVTTGDIMIDGGNSFYKDSIRRWEALTKKGISFIDCGTSGGLEGARHGACLMLGGDAEPIERLTWVWNALSAAPAGSAWKHVGPSGAGHFVKMVHNGIEYGVNQALGEGCEILVKGPYKLDIAGIAHLWNHGSIIRGYFLELLARALEKDPMLSSFAGVIGGGQTGRWALETAKELGVRADVLEEAMQARRRSQANPSFAAKVVSALRQEYGGHKEGTQR